MEEFNVDSIFTKLLDNHFFYIIKDENVTSGEYLTCCQQVFNYEMAANRKKTNAEKQRLRREKQKENKIVENNLNSIQDTNASSSQIL